MSGHTANVLERVCGQNITVEELYTCVRERTYSLQVQSTAYSTQHTVYSIEYTVYSIPYTVYSIQFTVYSIHSYSIKD